MFHRPASQLTVNPQHRDCLSRAGLDSLDALMQLRSAGDLDKPGLPSWRRRTAVTLAGRTYYLKRYRRPPLMAQLRQRLRGFAAMADVERTWLARLHGLGIAAPTVAAVGWRRRWGCEDHSLILLTQAPGQSLEQWVAGSARSRLADRAYRRRLSDALARLVGALHRGGLFHRDLYLCHIFLDDSDPAAPALSLIDLQRVIQPRLRRRRWAIKDLAALNYSTPPSAASTADRVRWFKRYRGVTRLSAADRRLIRAIVRRTRWTADRDRRRAAPGLSLSAAASPGPAHGRD